MTSNTWTTRTNRNSIALLVVILMLLGPSSIVLYYRMIRVVGQSTTSAESRNQNTVCSVRTVMYMDGFQWTSASLFIHTASTQPCLNLFVSHWTVDTPIKLFLASVLVFLLGILTEVGTTWIRQYHSHYRNSSSNKISTSYNFYSTLIQPSLHILLATFSYMNMVIIMTFSIELFIMLLAGIGIGHYYILVGEKITIVRSIPPNDNSISKLSTSTEPATWSTTYHDMTIHADTISIPCCEFLSSYQPNENNHCIANQDSYEHTTVEEDESSLPFLSQVS